MQFKQMCARARFINLAPKRRNKRRLSDGVKVEGEVVARAAHKINAGLIKTSVFFLLLCIIWKRER